MSEAGKNQFEENEKSERETILQVKNLKKYYMVGRKGLFGEKEYVRSVDGVSFELHRGETLAIVGESGCGKSTTVKSLLRVVEPTDGEVILNRQDFLKLKGADLKKARRNIKMIFQDPYSSLNPRMTVRDIIGEPADIEHVYKTEEEREKLILDTMEMVGLNKDFADRYPHEFSGGQRQRIGIARAIILRPEIVVCDEPVSALDVSIQAQILNLLMDLQEEKNLTYMFITHDMSVVKHISDDITVMYLGQMVEKAGSSEIFAHQYHPYTKALFSAAPTIDEGSIAESQELRGEIPSPIHLPSGCPFHDRCPVACPDCAREIPELKEVEPGHFAACHLL